MPRSGYPFVTSPIGSVSHRGETIADEEADELVGTALAMFRALEAPEEAGLSLAERKG